MGFFKNIWTWFTTRAVHLPEDRDSGGDWLRLYKEPIFQWLDLVAAKYATGVPSAAVLTNDIVKNMPVPDTIKLALRLFFIGVVENAIDFGQGSIDKVVAYLKNIVLTAS